MEQQAQALVFSLSDAIAFISFVVTTIIGVISINFAVRKAVLAYEVSSTRLIKNEITAIKGIKITFHDKPISELIASKIVLTNIGRCDITSEMFYPSAQLELITTGCFLGVTSLTNSHGPILVENMAPNRVRIKFSFLQPSKKIVINAFHSGTITVSGTLRDGKLVSK